MKLAKIFDKRRKGKGSRGRSRPPAQFHTKKTYPLSRLSLSMHCRRKEHSTFNSKQGNFSPIENVIDKRLPVIVLWKNFENRIGITELYKLLARLGMRSASFVDYHLAPIFVQAWIGIKYLCSMCILAFCTPGKWPLLWDNRIMGRSPSMGRNTWVCTNTNIHLIWMCLKPNVELLMVEKMWNCHILLPTNP